MYHFAESFYSLQGEGMRKGTANVFLRFAGCNLQCNLEEHGFDCDTDFTARNSFESPWEVQRHAQDLGGAYRCHNVIFTGGEPGLQLDDALVKEFIRYGWHTAVETNGMFVLPEDLDWVSCSPKRGIPLDSLKVEAVDEFRYVIGAGDDYPFVGSSSGRTSPRMSPPPAYYLSPAFDVETNRPHVGALEHCIEMVKENPAWRLSVQDHKSWGVR